MRLRFVFFVLSIRVLLPDDVEPKLELHVMSPARIPTTRTSGSRVATHVVDAAAANFARRPRSPPEYCLLG